MIWGRLGEQGRPSIPAPLAHVDVSLGKTLNTKNAPVAVPTVYECPLQLSSSHQGVNG